jgi:FKBP-type peptidyl-prolyl cis-trans isomerase
VKQLTIHLTVALLPCLASACNQSSVADAEPSLEAALTATAPTRQGTTRKPTQLPLWARSIPQNIPAPADVAAPPASAERTETGLASIVLVPATGNVDERPRAQDTVTVDYAGWTEHGVLFFASKLRAQPENLTPKGAPMKGFGEALQLLSVGERRRFWIPAELGFGKNPKDPMQPAGALTMEIELLGIDRAPDPPPAPPDLSEPPADAVKTVSGLAYRVLEKGTGKQRPKGHDYAHIEFTGWTAEGKVFDSSIPERKPRSITVVKAMSGLTEALKGMVEGEKRRLWLPADIAHGEEGTVKKPGGDLVMDVKLIRIVRGI